MSLTIHGTCTLSACRALPPGRGKHGGMGGFRVLGEGWGGEGRCEQGQMSEKNREREKVDQTEKKRQRKLLNMYPEVKRN